MLDLPNGYYLIREKLLDELQELSIASWDNDVKAWTFCGDNVVWYHDDKKYEVIKYICDPECSELK